MRLEDLTWCEAERVLTGEATVVIPLGAAAKEHGPHLRLNNDLILARYLTARIVDLASVVVAPEVPYHYYPAFSEYPGSVSLERDIATGLIVDICTSLASFGTRRFYVLNTGVSTVKSLSDAAERLQAHGVLLRYTDLAAALADVGSKILTQEGGSHADEGETSMMLYIDPSRVDMTRACKDFQPEASGPLRRSPAAGGCYSPSGVWGDATAATAEKGRQLIEALIAAVLADLEALQQAEIPARHPH